MNPFTMGLLAGALILGAGVLLGYAVAMGSIRMHWRLGSDYEDRARAIEDEGGQGFQ